MLSPLQRFVGACLLALLVGGAPTPTVAQVTVTPDGGASGTIPPSTSGHVANFTVTAYGYTYLDCWGSSGISCSVDPDVYAWGATNVQVTFSTSSSQGTKWVNLEAKQFDPPECDPDFMQCDEYIDYGSRVYTVNSPPNADFSWTPTTPDEGQSVSFNGTLSSDPGGSITSYAWAFGDGGTASGSTTNHTYGAGAQYQARLIVTDNLGAADTITKSITVNSLAPSGLSLEDANPGLELNRSECVNISVAAGAVVCDDFQHVYAFTPITVLNRTRQLALIYNRSSQDHAGIIGVNVEVPSGQAKPDSICVSVDIGSASPSECYDDSFYSQGTWTRFSLSADYGAMSNTLDLLEYDATVTGYDGGLPVTDTTATHYYVAMDNSKIFGRGWWLGSYEQLRVLPTSPYGDVLVWMGGDQSYRVYKKQATNVYVAETRARPDTIIKNGSEYIRNLIGGGEVYFNSTGVHQKTVDRLGYETQFVHSTIASQVRPTQVKFTTPSAGTIIGFKLNYNGTTGRLEQVQVRNAAGTGYDTYSVSTTALSSGYKINSITSPTDATTSALTTTFNYAASTGDMTQVIEPGGRTTTVSYQHRKVYQVVVTNTGLSATYVIDPASTIGLVAASYPGNMDGVAPVSSIRTKLNGARTEVVDTTSFYTTGWGALRGTRDALGNETWIERGNGAYPGLPTRVEYPNGWVVKASYDANGLLYQSTDSSNSAVTTYAWNLGWSQPTQITSPEGVVSKFGYNATTGNRTWQAVAADTVHFSYNGYKQLSSVTDPEGNTSTISYDAMGNLTSQAGPGSIGDWTHYGRDGRGYATSTRSKVGEAARDSVYVTTSYDVLGRVRQTDQRTNSTVDSLMWLVTTNVYNSSTGLKTKTEAFGGATPADTATTGATEWFYDGFGRLSVEKRPTGTDTLRYDVAGNVTSKVLVGSAVSTITMTYDVLNRVGTQVVPNRTVSLDSINGIPFPLYDTEGIDVSGSTVTIFGDSLSFAYDDMGNLVTADNRYAKIRRQYTLNGALLKDSLALRNYHSATNFGNHVYTVRYTYNKDGQRTAIHHPSWLSSGNDSTAYAYSGSTGRLSSITDALGSTYSFFYNANGQPDSVSFPGGYRVMAYDAGGRLTDLGSNVTGFMYSAGMTYDPAGHILEAGTEGSAFSYNGFGHVVLGNLILPLQPSPESFERDAFGRAISSVRIGTWGAPDRGYDNSYHPWGGGLAETAGAWIDLGESSYDPTNWIPDASWYEYDGRGNVTASHEYSFAWEPIGYGCTWCVVRMIADFENHGLSYYDAQGRLMAHQATRDSTEHRWSGGGYLGAFEGDPFGAFEEYWYDALGRRVLKRSRQASPLCEFTSPSPGRCYSNYERFVWDGDQILWELRQGDTGGTTGDTKNPSNGTSTGEIGYVHAGGIDNPVGMMRNGASVVLHTGWRGVFQGATNTSGSAVFTDVPWPGGAWRVNLKWTDARTNHSWVGSLPMGQNDHSGLQYRRNRYYDPSSGQFTQQDPIGIAGGLNLYGYANGDPVNYSDPFGLDPCKSSSAWTECLAQGLANFGARRGGALGGTALFVGAALNAGLEASGINAAASAGDALGSGDLAEGGVALALAAPVGRPGRLFLSRGKGVVQTGQASQLAQYLGYGTRARGAPVSSHGQAVFTNGRNYISIDVDSHNGGVWKMFNRRGEEIGTFDAMLTQIK